jgi:hypothetical protein
VGVEFVPDAQKGAAGLVPVNAQTISQSRSYIERMMYNMGKPSATAKYVSGAIIAAIGSYPFAGWLKEESLTQIGGSSTGAIIAGNYDAAKIAMQQEEEILNPDLWRSILAGVPYANTLTALKEFYETSRISHDVKNKVLDDLIAQKNSGESDNDMYARIAAEREAARIAEREAEADYYAEVERQRAEAKAKERAAEEKYWNDILSKKETNVKAKENYDDDYWTEYYKIMAKIKANEAPSNLKFGLL